MATLFREVNYKLQALVNDIDMGIIGNFPAVNISFILPLICFIAIISYGYRARKNYEL